MTDSFDGRMDLGYIIEGHLRKDGDEYVIQTPDSDFVLNNVLARYANKEIRFTLVDIREAEHLHNTLMQGNHDDESGSGS